MAHANVIYSQHILATTSNKLRLPAKALLSRMYTAKCPYLNNSTEGIAVNFTIVNQENITLLPTGVVNKPHLRLLFTSNLVNI